MDLATYDFSLKLIKMITLHNNFETYIIFRKRKKLDFYDVEVKTVDNLRKTNWNITQMRKNLVLGGRKWRHCMLKLFFIAYSHTFSTT